MLEPSTCQAPYYTALVCIDIGRDSAEFVVSDMTELGGRR